MELGYRFMKRLASGLTPHFSIALGYNHLWNYVEQIDLVFRYHVPVLRVGGGLMWGIGKRFGIGFEVSYLGGYPFLARGSATDWQTTNGNGWQYNAGTIHVIMTF